MKPKIIFLLLIFFPVFFSAAHAKSNDLVPQFTYRIQQIPSSVQTLMKKYTWHPGCPVSLSDLAYIKLSYWGFDQRNHQGILIVNKTLALQIVAIFKQLYDQKFPIERMQPMYMFKGNDDAAMAVNNTSSFNCRAITGTTNKFSQHSYGRAIDINTLLNPYVKENQVLPAAGRAYLDRSKVLPGMIIKNDAIYHDFISRDWAWGGNWVTLKDYQHFEKQKQ